MKTARLFTSMVAATFAGFLYCTPCKVFNPETGKTENKFIGHDEVLSAWQISIWAGCYLPLEDKKPCMFLCARTGMLAEVGRTRTLRTNVRRAA